MFRKLSGLLIAFMLTVGPAFAAPVSKTIIELTRLDDSPTSATSSSANIQDYERVAFFVNYDETEVGGVSAAVTLDISYDGTNWIDASFYDYAGGATLQTSETLTADGWYYCWFNKDLNVPYVRMVVAATGSDTDDLIDVTAYLTGTK